MAFLPASKVSGAGSRERGKAQIGEAVANLGITLFNQKSQQQARADRTQEVLLRRRQEAVNKRLTARAKNDYLTQEQDFISLLDRNPDTYMEWPQRYQDFSTKTGEDIRETLNTQEQKDSFDLVFAAQTVQTRQKLLNKVHNLDNDVGRAELDANLNDLEELYSKKNDDNERLMVASVAVQAIQGARESGYITGQEAVAKQVDLSSRFAEAQFSSDVRNNPSVALVRVNRNHYKTDPVTQSKMRDRADAAVEVRRKEKVAQVEREEQDVEKHTKLEQFNTMRIASILHFGEDGGVGGQLTSDWIMEQSDVLTFKQVLQLQNMLKVDPSKVATDPREYISLLNKALDGDLVAGTEAQEAYISGRMTQEDANDIRKAFDKRTNTLTSAGYKQIDDAFKALIPITQDDTIPVKNVAAQKLYRQMLDESALKKEKLTREKVSEMVDFSLRELLPVKLDITRRPQRLIGDVAEPDINATFIATETAWKNGEIDDATYDRQLELIEELDAKVKALQEFFKKGK